MRKPSPLDLVADPSSSAPAMPYPALPAPGGGCATPRGTAINQAGLLLRAEGARPRKSRKTLGIMSANECGHHERDFAATGSAGRDFVAGMVPPHQAAMETARIMLQHGAEPEVGRIGGGHHWPAGAQDRPDAGVLQHLRAR
jgi:hypothetical protein